MAYMTMIVGLFILVKFVYSSSPLDDFLFNGYALKLGGTAKLDSNGLFTLTNTTMREIGHAFYNFPIQFKNSTNNGSVFSFSTTFIFAIVPEYPRLGGHGLAFVVSPSKELQGALPTQYLGIFNNNNIGNRSNHIVAVELDTVQDFEFEDIDDNHIGIDINSLVSIKSASAGYFPTRENETFKDLNLKSGEPMQVWVEYNGVDKQLNVTLSPINVSKPDLPLLSLTQDLSPVLHDYMYVGFSTSTGLLASSHYILGWSFKMNGQAEPIDLSRLPKIPGTPQVKENKKRMLALAIVVPFIGLLVLLVLTFGALLIMRKKKYTKELEDWEFQYGPHKFCHKVVCGRRPVEHQASPEKIILIDWVFECLERGNILEAIDQCLGAEYVVDEAELVLKLGLLCSHAVGAARPSMSDVVKYLEGEAQLPENLNDIVKSWDFSEATNGQDVAPISVPSVTITEPFVSRGR
ncbi:L-type lectin-domain containing receptor kinase V.9 [Camellia lanceoleosa]|uniref:L-type lectin-domain containing receptor kinase V.9 n=1 Tax=Camellia lanceoleosa TaxID=1840588 RepID=A0ACC0GB17_9ERIC|nr:L-type lectin-domain containing receptor kinase V.9 [Camellia lanceoleosa]